MSVFRNAQPDVKAILTWAKQKFGNGQWLRRQTEHCHLAVRGKPTILLTNQSTLLTAPVGCAPLTIALAFVCRWLARVEDASPDE